MTLTTPYLIPQTVRKAQCQNITSIQEYALRILPNATYELLERTIGSSRWLLWDNFDEVSSVGGM